MHDQSYIRILITEDFLKRVMQEYTRRAEMVESKKNGVKKNRITKSLVCKIIIKDMQEAGLI